MKLKSKNYSYIFVSLLLLYVSSSAAPLPAGWVGVSNATSLEVEELQDFVTDQMAELQDKCVAESSTTAALMRFSFTTLNLRVTSMTTFVPDFSIGYVAGAGPILPSEMNTASGTINGPWRIAPSYRAQYILPDYELYDGYVSRVLMEYIAVPGKACSTTPPCPNAWANFSNQMQLTADGINTRSPTSTLVRPVVQVVCETLEPSPVDLGTLTAGDFVAVPLPALSPTPPERGYKSF